MLRTFEVHTFIPGRAGRVARGEVVPVTTEDEARRKAAFIVPPVVGAIALRSVRNDAGKLQALEDVASFGEVPANYAERLMIVASL